MYDHNQTLVPDSFLALHSVHGRPLLPRETTEARYELCEDLALHTAAFLAAHEQDADAADEALQAMPCRPARRAVGVLGRPRRRG